MPDEGAVPAGWSRSRLGDHFLRVNRRNAAGVRRVLTASGDRGLIDQEEFFSKRVAGADLSTYLHIKNGEFALLIETCVEESKTGFKIFYAQLNGIPQRFAAHRGVTQKAMGRQFELKAKQ